MVRIFCGAIVVLFLLAAVSCTGQELDSAAVKAFLNTVVESMGQAISGGVLTSANTLGGMPHFAFGFGANVVNVEAKNPIDTSQTLVALAPTGFAVASMGVLAGLYPNRMVKGIGSVDLFGRLGYFPTVGDYAQYAKGAPVILGGGIKVGLFQNSLLAPAISLTASYSRISEMKFVFNDTTADAVAKLNLSTFSIHGDVSKNLVLFTPYAGLGWDMHYFKGEWDVVFKDPVRLEEAGSIKLTPTSIRAYGGVELSLVVLNLDAEGGMTGGNLFFAAGARIKI
jgi:hypothetical protein